MYSNADISKICECVTFSVKTVQFVKKHIVTSNSNFLYYMHLLKTFSEKAFQEESVAVLKPLD